MGRAPVGTQGLDDTALGDFDVSGMARTVGMKDRLLVLSKYSRLGASSRLRTLQYRRWLEDAGFDGGILSVFRRSLSPKALLWEKTHADLIGYYSQTVFTHEADTSPRLIWVEYEALPWLPWMFERALLPASSRS